MKITIGPNERLNQFGAVGRKLDITTDETAHDKSILFLTPPNNAVNKHHEGKAADIEPAGDTYYITTDGKDQFNRVRIETDTKGNVVILQTEDQRSGSRLATVERETGSHQESIALIGEFVREHKLPREIHAAILAAADATLRYPQNYENRKLLDGLVAPNEETTYSAELKRMEIEIVRSPRKASSSSQVRGGPSTPALTPPTETWS